jgi:L-lactate dehydrogenase complex protein LldF
MGRWMMRAFPFILNNKSINPWYKQREMPEAPKQSFRDWYKKNKQ